MIERIISGGDEIRLYELPFGSQGFRSGDADWDEIASDYTTARQALVVAIKGDGGGTVVRLQPRDAIPRAWVAYRAARTKLLHTEAPSPRFLAVQLRLWAESCNLIDPMYCDRQHESTCSAEEFALGSIMLSAMVLNQFHSEAYRNVSMARLRKAEERDARKAKRPRGSAG